MERRWPKAGDVPHEGLSKVERRLFKFRFTVESFGVQGSGVWG